MKKKNINNDNNLVYISNRIKVNKEANEQLFFEVDKEITSDLAEAIAMCINLGINDKKFLDISFKIITNTISPDKALYWLSGGDKEWATKQHYTKSWNQVYSIFVAEFGPIILDIVNKSETLKDVKNGFVNKLNLPILYEFSLEKGFIKNKEDEYDK
jgi:hypothetical protein